MTQLDPGSPGAAAAHAPPVDITLPLAWLVRALGLPHPPPDGAPPRPPEVPWHDALIEDGIRAGMTGSLLERSPREAVLTAADRALVTLHRADGGAPTWLILRGRTPLKGELILLRGQDVERIPVGALELAAALGVDPAQPRPWVALESALPLEPLRQGADTPEAARPLRRLGVLVRQERPAILSLVIYSAASGLLALATPIAAQALVSTVAFGTLLQPLVVLALLLLGALGLGGALRILEVYVAELIQRRVFVATAMDLAHRLVRVAPSSLRDRHGPELIGRFYDVVTVQKAASELLLSGIDLALQTVMGLLLLAFYHPVLLAFDLVLLVCLGGLFLMGWGAPKTAIKESSAKHALAGWLQELARAPEAFRAPAGEILAVEHADHLAQRYLEHRSGHFRIVLRQTVAGVLVQILGSAALLGIGGALVIAGQLTLGQLVAAELVVALVVANYAKLGKHCEAFYDLLAALEKIGSLVDLPLTAPRGYGALPEGGGLALAVTGRGALASLSLGVAAGERVCVAGLPEAARGALLSALVDGVAPPELLVSVGGRALRNGWPVAPAGAVQALTGASVIRGTILDNLRLARAGLTEAQAERALAAAGLSETIRNLPQGIHTPLRADGEPLGEEGALRLTLARALLAGPQLLVIDGRWGSQLPGLHQGLMGIVRRHARGATLLYLHAGGGPPEGFHRILHAATSRLLPPPRPQDAAEPQAQEENR